MKEEVLLILEVESEDEEMLSKEFIKDDIERELNCACNYYTISFISIGKENHGKKFKYAT